jgi:hypothetical protein
MGVRESDPRALRKETAAMDETPAEGRTERETARIQRVRQRLTFPIAGAGIQLHIDGTLFRTLIWRPARKRDMPPLVALLEQAAELGAIHGQCDRWVRADVLAGRHTPGHVLYDLTPDWSIVMHRDGITTRLPVPILEPDSITGQTVWALDAVFEIAGQLADDGEPDAAPAADAEPAGRPGCPEER